MISNATGSQGLATGLVVGPTSITAALGAVTSPTLTLTITAQVETLLYSFAGGNDGVTPAAGLIQGADGNFLWNDSVRRHDRQWHGLQGHASRGRDGTVFVHWR